MWLRHDLLQLSHNFHLRVVALVVVGFGVVVVVGVVVDVVVGVVVVVVGVVVVVVVVGVVVVVVGVVVVVVGVVVVVVGVVVVVVVIGSGQCTLISTVNLNVITQDLDIEKKNTKLCKS